MSAERLALTALVIAGINAAAQFGMFLIHCRSDKRERAETRRRFRSLGIK